MFRLLKKDYAYKKFKKLSTKNKSLGYEKICPKCNCTDLYPELDFTHADIHSVSGSYICQSCNFSFEDEKHEFHCYICYTDKQNLKLELLNERRKKRKYKRHIKRNS